VSSLAPELRKREICIIPFDCPCDKHVSGVKRRLFGYGDKVGSGPVEVLPAEDGRRRRPPAGPALRKSRGSCNKSERAVVERE